MCSHRLRDIDSYAWRKLAADLRLDEEALVTRLGAMTAALPDHAADVARACREAGVSDPMIERLADAIPRRAADCARGQQ